MATVLTVIVLVLKNIMSQIAQLGLPISMQVDK